MLQRYIGNKNVLLEAIIKSVRQLSEPGDMICDAFSGSAAVSVGLKRMGYRVAANDINLLSWVYGIAYLMNSELPEINLYALLGRRDRTCGALTAASGKEAWEI